MLTPLKSTIETEKIVSSVRKYRRVTNQIFIACVYVFAAFEFNCSEKIFCTQHETRQLLLTASDNDSMLIFFVLGFVSILTPFFPEITNFVIDSMIDAHSQTSNDRRISKLILAHNWDGIVDLLVYGVPLPKPNSMEVIQGYVAILCSDRVDVSTKKEKISDNEKETGKEKGKEMVYKYTNSKLFATLGSKECKKLKQMLIAAIEGGYWDCQCLTYEKIHEFSKTMENFHFYYPIIAKEMKNTLVISKTGNGTWAGIMLKEMCDVFETLSGMEKMNDNIYMRKKHHVELSQQLEKYSKYSVELNISMIDKILENISKLSSNRFAYFYFGYFYHIVQKRDKQLFDVKREDSKWDEKGQFRRLWGVFQKVTVAALSGGEMNVNSITKCLKSQEIQEIIEKFNEYYPLLTQQQLDRMGLSLDKLGLVDINSKDSSKGGRMFSATTVSDMADVEKDSHSQGAILTQPPPHQVSHALVVVLHIGDYDADVNHPLASASTDQARMIHTFGCLFNYAICFQTEEKVNANAENQENAKNNEQSEQKNTIKKTQFVHGKEISILNQEIENSTELDILNVIKNKYKFKIYWTCDEIEDFLQIVQNHIESPQSPKYDAMITTVTCHGESETIITSDGDEMPHEALFFPFNSNYCASLRGKPKIWIMDMCRGGRTVVGIPLTDNKEGDDDDDDDDDERKDNVDLVENVLHEVSNRRCIWTTPNGYAAADGSYEGGYLIRGAADVLNEFANQETVVDLDKTLMQVRRRMYQLAGTFTPHIGEDQNHMLRSVKLRKNY